MFTRGKDGVYRSETLLRLSWLEHGFGSRHSSDWPGTYTQLKQTHSATVVNAGPASGALGEGDALITASPGNWLGIRTADCVPVLIADPEHHAVAAVHAGWRGTAAGIAAATVRELSACYGSNPESLIVAIGPCIQECCFKVGPDVAAMFAPWVQGAELRAHIDLVAVNRRQLESEGVAAGNVHVAGLCTVCTPGEFHSWRRDRERSGRMVAAIKLLR